MPVVRSTGIGHFLQGTYRSRDKGRGIRAWVRGALVGLDQSTLAARALDAASCYYTRD